MEEVPPAARKGGLPEERMDVIAVYAPMFLCCSPRRPSRFVFWGRPRSSAATRSPAPRRTPPSSAGARAPAGARLKLSVKFYLTAILFVVFDIEAVFVYPWAVHFRTLGWFGLVEMLGFLAVIVVALVYVWKKGALEWET